MRFLLDTKVLIKLEPGALNQLEQDAATAARLNQLLTGGEHAVFVHPAIEHDINRDDDLERGKLNRFLFMEKHALLPHPPASAPLEPILGVPAHGSNDWVDLQLIAAVKAGAVQYVVSEDAGLLRKMRRSGLGDRALNLSNAVQILEDLFEHEVQPPPVVFGVPVYGLDREDPIWDSFRDEYVGFDEWFEKAAEGARPAWYIGDEGYDAICIVKTENDEPHGIEGKVLKVSSFKVAESARGSKFGELLLKTAFRHSSENNFDSIYVEVFPHHDGIVSLFEDFGFEVSESHTTARGEHVLIKPLRSKEEVTEGLTPYEFHRKHGPPAIHPSARLFVVPILPRFHRMLFPDVEADLLPLLESHPRLPGMELDPEPPRPFGNSIKKAYLSHSGIRQLAPGDALMFYRSEDLQAITTIGVVEDTLVTADARELAAFVGARTVYTFEEIQRMVDKAEVLGVLFRHDRSVESIPLHEIIDQGALGGAPQSISQVKEKGLFWMRTQIEG